MLRGGADAAAALTALQASIDGAVVTPGTPGYESLRSPASPLVDDVRPLAVVVCGTVEDVVEALGFARRHGVPVVPRSGGHCFAGRSTSPGLVLDVSPLADVVVEGDVAVVGAGVRLGRLYDALQSHGRTVPAGCGPTVGIAGLTLGGGIGVLGRSHGLTCDRLVGADVVLVDGGVVRCAADRRADLLWGLRGAGGGQFGVVTSLILTTVPAPTTTAFHLRWPARHSTSAVGAWQRWAPDAPDHVDATLRLTAPAHRDEPPGVHLVGAVHDTPREAVAVLDQFVLRVGADPAAVSTGPGSYSDAKSWLSGRTDEHEAADAVQVTVSELFDRDLPADVVSSLLDHLTARRDGGRDRHLTFTPLGGAYNRVRVGATAFAHRRQRFMLEHTTSGPRTDLGPARTWARRSRSIAHRVGTGRVYPNFPDLGLADWALAYHGENLARLRHLKRRYDPDRVLGSRQSL